MVNNTKVNLLLSPLKKKGLGGNRHKSQKSGFQNQERRGKFWPDLAWTLDKDGNVGKQSERLENFLFCNKAESPGTQKISSHLKKHHFVSPRPTTYVSVFFFLCPLLKTSLEKLVSQSLLFPEHPYFKQFLVVLKRTLVFFLPVTARTTTETRKQT